MRSRQRGAGLLVAVILIVTVAAFAVIVAASQSGGDVRGNDLHADSVQALLLAETGVERALKRFATGTACNALGPEIINDTSSLQTAGATIDILAGVTTDFNSVAFVAVQTLCRVRVTATINASGVSRTIHAIVDRNLLEGPDNPTFNNPLTGAATPSGWGALNPAVAPFAFAPNGSADGTAPNCRRSAWTAKNNPAAARRATGTVNVNFTLTPGSTTNLFFYRRVINRPAVNCGAALPGAGAALPGACGAATDSTVCFRFVGVGGPGNWTIGSNVAASPGPGLAACPTTFNPCSTSYPGYPAKTTIPGGLVMAGATSVTQFIYYLQLQNVGRREIFLDHIEATNFTAIGAAHVRVWRDCSSAADPVNCV